MADGIKALTIDVEKDGWDKSRGFVMRDVPMPVLDEKKNPEDALSVILKIRYAGVCGSDRGSFERDRRSSRSPISSDLQRNCVFPTRQSMRFLAEASAHFTRSTRVLK